MKRIGLILMAMIAIAFLVPACMAQSTQTINVKGNVYNGALLVNGATVQIYSYDGQQMGSTPAKTTVSGPIDGVDGTFEFDNVPYDPSKTFNWVIQASGANGAVVHAMVYIVPPQSADQVAKVEPLMLDLNSWDWKTDVMGMVQSANLAKNAIPVTGASVSIYAYSNGTYGTTPVATATTDSTGQFRIQNILGYGAYQAKVVSKDNHVAWKNFTAYQQQTPLDIVMTGLYLEEPSATAGPNPSGGSSGGLLPNIPGFEAVLALAGLSGAAFLVMRKR